MATIWTTIRLVEHGAVRELLLTEHHARHSQQVGAKGCGRAGVLLKDATVLHTNTKDGGRRHAGKQ